jgi:hypothetical protein
MAQFDMGSEKNQKTGGEKCYEFGWNPDPSNARHHQAADGYCLRRQLPGGGSGGW